MWSLISQENSRNKSVKVPTPKRFDPINPSRLSSSLALQWWLSDQIQLQSSLWPGDGTKRYQLYILIERVDILTRNRCLDSVYCANSLIWKCHMCVKNHSVYYRPQIYLAISDLSLLYSDKPTLKSRMFIFHCHTFVQDFLDFSPPCHMPPPLFQDAMEQQSRLHSVSQDYWAALCLLMTGC